MNKANDHVLLFVRFLDEKKTRFLAYETGSPPTWKVIGHLIHVAYVNGLGYRPYPTATAESGISAIPRFARRARFP